MSFLGGGGQSPPAPPPFHPIDISGPHGIAFRALQQDVNRYLSYQFPVFPGMADLRKNEIEDAYKQLTGPLSPEFQQQFLSNAQLAQQNVTGGGNLYSGMALGQKGSLAQGATSASFARQTMAKQDYDRTRLESLVQANPIPGLGLTQQDLLNLYVYNTGAQNASLMSNYANQIAGANAQFASENQLWGSIGNIVGGLGSAYGNYVNAGGFGGGFFGGFDTSAIPSDYGQNFYG
jgi:hypothetical protein